MPGAPPALRFTPREARLIARLRTPSKVQAWLNGLPYNWETEGATARTFRGVVEHKTAHCLEAALSAATILEQHGYRPRLMDLESEDLLDHVLYVYQQDGKWGSIGRSRCPGLHGRKPVFSTLRALAKSYAQPFIDTTGRLKGYGVLDLATYPNPRWRLARHNVWFIEDELNRHAHQPLPTSEREYRFWKAKFDQWWGTNGRPAHRWPTYYPAKQRNTWTRYKP